MRACLVAVLVALSACCCAPALARAASQDVDRASAERSLERFQAYLTQMPFHGPGFERIIADLVAKAAAGTATPPGPASELHGDEEEDEEDAAEPAPTPATDAEQVLLARLYARTDRTNEALAILETLENFQQLGAQAEKPEQLGDEPVAGADSARRAFGLALRRLRGELLIGAGEVERGLAALDAVAATTREGARPPADPRALEALHTLRAEAALRLGDRARATLAFEDLARVDPASFDLALDVAERLARANLIEEATAPYGAALALAGDDVPRRCRARAAFGELHERGGTSNAALTAYGEAFDLLGRGHWLKRLLELRIVAVHTREGSLPRLATELRAALETRRDDLDRRSLLARVEVALKDLPAARVTLEAACRDFPRDLALGRELLDVLALVKDDDARVAELQRLVGEHPSELELYIELGQVLASSGRLDQARRQWQHTLEVRLQDPGLCLRLAGLHARSGLVDEALELVARARAAARGARPLRRARAPLAERGSSRRHRGRARARGGRCGRRPRATRDVGDDRGRAARAASLLQDLVASLDAATARDAA